MAGPFPITEQVCHAYHLELSSNMEIHDIISLDKLQKAADDPLPGQIKEPPEPI